MAFLLYWGDLFTLSRLGEVVDDDLSKSHEHDEQAYAGHTEFVGQGPEKDEESDAQADVSDSFGQLSIVHSMTVAALLSCYLLEELGRNRLSVGDGLLGQSVGCLTVLVSEVADNPYYGYRNEDECKDAEDGYF